MPILKQSEKTFVPIPPGTHPARCYAMISLGTQPVNNPKYNPSWKVVLTFEFPNESIEISGVKKPMIASQFLNAYLGSVKKPSKTNLFLTSWRGRPFSEEELKGFDLSKVVGAPCLINIVHEAREGATREVIASISPLTKGMTMPPAVTPPLIYEIEQGKDNVFESLPEWTQKMILQCHEWSPVAKPADDVNRPEPDNENESDDVPF